MILPRFIKIAAVTIASAFAGFGLGAMRYSEGKGEKLSPSQNLLAQTLFAEHLDVKSIRLHQTAFHIVAAPRQGHIELYKEQFYYKNDADVYGDFAQALTYEWQNQQGATPLLRLFQPSGYNFGDDRTFDDLTLNQQASVIEDYARRFLHPGHAEAVNYTGKDGATQVFDDRLATIVETRFPHLKKMRLARGEPLTAGETKLVKSIFGQDFNTRSVRKHRFASYTDFNGTDENTNACVRYGDTVNIHFISKEMQEKDFSRGNFRGYGTFMHEMTHIWQHRVKEPTDTLDAYHYTLTEKTVFTDLPSESQAHLIKDYVLAFIHPDQWRTDYNRGKNPQSCAAYRLMAKVVETQFPEARKSRRAIEKQFGVVSLDDPHDEKAPHDHGFMQRPMILKK